VQPQTFFALITGKLVKFASLKLKIGGGTAAPGLAALTIDKNFIKNLSQNNSLNSVIITGTNGKTTTARMLAHIFQKSGFKTIHNRAGSNLLRGIAASFVENASLSDKLNREWGIWEVDEAVMSEAITQLNPKIVAINNLFRDQLDRFGEIDKLRKLWSETVNKLDKNQVLVLNADDPQISWLGQGTRAKVLRFGIEAQNYKTSQLPKAADARFCPNCQTPLSYKAVFVYHMGDYFCPKCFIRRQKPEIGAVQILEIKPERARLKLSAGGEVVEVKLSVGGLYNIYNALAAATTAIAAGIDLRNIKAGLEKFKAAFGRVEKFEVNSKILTMYLVKNPAGFSEVIRTLFSDDVKKDILVALNDKIADGKDVSWIWDVEFGQMGRNFRKVFVTGQRANDLALRLKYAGIGNFALIENDMEKALKAAIANSAKNLYLLPTYTAMLELRKILNKMGVGAKFWQD